MACETITETWCFNLNLNLNVLSPTVVVHSKVEHLHGDGHGGGLPSLLEHCFSVCVCIATGSGV